MPRKVINKAQSFLTVIYPEEDRSHQIVNIELLLLRHPPEKVISFLCDLRKEYIKKLRRQIHSDVTDAAMDPIIAKNFRLKMAINTIRNYIKQEERAA
ncbi:hypothetical protein [Desulfosudis oleivorans]|uniref:Uncharacterized protein n=1 Tax=Desulfosudis oleivorans (strain DSM 6200 / JCM 39069 / Hxd3) TaxID=96561 RepID=A8ZYJ8_DESOH|nr:hypothetical protein [Desulfosudis oleivorans]ABW68723.1 hypothetical protein Dole_2920 [Desulfosudis oleivorans Hxd3]